MSRLILTAGRQCARSIATHPTDTTITVAYLLTYLLNPSRWRTGILIATASVDSAVHGQKVKKSKARYLT